MTWSKISLPIKVILAAEGLALYRAFTRRDHGTAFITALFGAGILLGEWQVQKNADAATSNSVFATGPKGTVQSITGLGRLGHLKVVR